MIHKSLVFWTLVAGLLAYVAKFFFPAFPLDAAGILAIVLFLLGLFGVVPTARALGFSSIFSSMAFWVMVAGLVSFVLHFFVPTFPMDEGAILAVIVFILAIFGINPELRLRGLK